MKPSPIWLLRAAALLLLIVPIACSNARSTDAGIQGTAIYGPTCPVQRVGAPPCERPYSGVIVFKKGDKQVATVRSAANGSFRISLAPGTYTVTSNGSGLPFVKPLDVVVHAHAYTTITGMFDSGIR